ncbi:MAG: DUF2948 family protein [Alphaproteobacteria bacterium]|nr:DUF2948 family protein [Alphaproteobacteria bacterium]
MSERLKLRATSIEELQVIAACIQDALAPLADMTWMQDQNRFAVVFNRFRWESAGEKPPFERTHALLSFQNVRAVRTSNVDRGQPDRLLSLLTLAPADGAAVDIAFAGGATVRVESEPLDCILEDLGEPWPTVWRPDHDAGGDGK